MRFICSFWDKINVFKCLQLSFYMLLSSKRATIKIPSFGNTTSNNLINRIVAVGDG